MVGQLNSIVMQPVIYGISLNYGQIGQLSTPTATDCKATVVTVKAYTYGSQNKAIVDVNPSTGALCAGTWNRNLNVIPDYTVCTATNPPASNSMTYLTAEANGVTSNPIPVYTHPVVTSVLLGTPTANCTTDPTTNCCPLAAANTITAPAYSGNSCISQGSTGQLVARVFAGTGTYDATTGTTTGTLQNISCQAGHLTYTANTSGLVSIDENGVATAELPGSTVITASVSNAGSSAGFFSTCPPASINLSVPNSSSTALSVNQNYAQPLTATVLDTRGVTLTGLSLEYVSTTPTTIPVASTGIVTPSYPGAASITAICQPATCNPSPFNQIGLFGNGKPLASNAIDITTPGTNSTLLYIASTDSRYLVPVDFTTSTLGTAVQLPYVPNSMVISEDGTSIYMGSSTELMVVSASTDGITRQDLTVPGTVLAVSPDNSTVVIADAARKLIYLEAAAGGVTSEYGWSGNGTPHAQWTPDSATVYITVSDPTTSSDQLLVYSTFTGWNNITPTPNSTGGNYPLDVAVTVPSIGAYLAGSPTTAVGYCPASTFTTTNDQTTVTNIFNPQADSNTAVTDRIAATNDGKHILGAAVSNMLLSDLQLTLPTGPCPSSGDALSFTSVATTSALSGITPTAITGVFPTSDSTAAVVTYTGTGGVLPWYAPSSAGTATPGTLTNITLSGTAIAPVAGVWSTDNLTFYAGTSGDNLVHLITRSAAGSTLSDSKTIAPNLPIDPNITNPTSTIAVPNLMVQKPRKTT
ncbi:hypothetical protein HDF17_001613 [Granulicella arctica]|uniref:BIG2 domain-containing protein n=1 Tax=Granulicella arctica TaxID=940613 RepID=A0A7Y9PHL8_9BACT|nr:hypothetical protein [Granulicella arctica]